MAELVAEQPLVVMDLGREPERFKRAAPLAHEIPDPPVDEDPDEVVVQSPVMPDPPN